MQKQDARENNAKELPSGHHSREKQGAKFFDCVVNNLKELATYINNDELVVQT